MSEGTDAEIVRSAIRFSYPTGPGDPQERYDAAEDRRAETHAALDRILADRDLLRTRLQRLVEDCESMDRAGHTGCPHRSPRWPISKEPMMSEGTDADLPLLEVRGGRTHLCIGETLVSVCGSFFTLNSQRLVAIRGGMDLVTCHRCLVSSLAALSPNGKENTE